MSQTGRFRRRAERSWALAATSLAFLAAVLLTTRQASPTGSGPGPERAAALTPWRVAFLGALLLIAGGVLALNERVRGRPATTPPPRSDGGEWIAAPIH